MKTVIGKVKIQKEPNEGPPLSDQETQTSANEGLGKISQRQILHQKSHQRRIRRHQVSPKQASLTPKEFPHKHWVHQMVNLLRGLTT